MKALVTGGAGFIGSNLVRSLIASGNDVRVLDDLSTGSIDNLLDLNGDVDFVSGDIRDHTTVLGAAEGCEVIYHLAALPSVARSVADPIGSHRTNVDGTLNVLTAARDLSVRRVVYASSSSVYGNTPTLPKHEDMPVNTMSPYAASKLAGEAYCRAFSRVYALETVSLRFFNVFGARQDPASEYAAVIPRFITRMLEGEPPEVFGDGRQSRDFTHISNVVQACMRAAEAGPAAAGGAFNIGCGGRISLRGLIRMLNTALGTTFDPIFMESRKGDVRHSEAAISKAHELLGYRPLVTMQEGLAFTVEWFSSQRAPAD